MSTRSWRVDDCGQLLDLDSCLVQVRRLSKCLAGRAVLRDVDCELRAGEIVALTGANGAGKTTLLGCLAGLIRPDVGEIRCGGRPARGNEIANRCRVGMVSHELQLYSHLTMRENLLFAARMQGVRRAASHVSRFLQLLGLAKSADCFPEQLSRGNCQRYSIARAVLHDPRIVLLDEPFASLDAAGHAWLTRLLQDLRRRRCAVCFATHHIDLLSPHVDRVFHLQEGTLHDRGRESTSLTGAVA